MYLRTKFLALALGFSITVLVGTLPAQYDGGAAGPKLKQHIKAHDELLCLAFSKDGKLLASGPNFSRTAKIWDVATGNTVKEFTKKDSFGVDGILFLDSKTVLSLNDGSTLIAWSIATGKEIRSLPRRGVGVYYFETIALSPDGRTLATAGCKDVRDEADQGIHPDHGDCVVEFIDAASLKPTGETIAERRDGYTRTLNFSPDGSILYGQGANYVMVWDISEKREIRAWKPHAEWLISMSLSPDGKVLATAGCDYTEHAGCDDSSVKFWDASTGRELDSIGDNINYVLFGPDGTLLTVEGDLLDSSGKVSLWRMPDKKKIATMPGYQPCAFGPIGSGLIATGNNDSGSIDIWDIGQ